MSPVEADPQFRRQPQAPAADEDDTSMKIVQVGPYPPPYGGVARNLVAIRTFLRQRQIPCAVINITSHRSADGEEVYHPTGPLALIRLLIRLRPDIIHIHFGGMLTPRLLALYLVCTLLPGRTVLTFHSGGYPTSPEGQKAGPGSFAGRVFRRLDRLIAVNAGIAAFFRQIGVAPERIRTIVPHAASPGEVSDTLPPALDAFFSSHHPVLLSVGGLLPEYDVASQIAVIGDIRKVWPRAGLCAIGSGTLDGELRRQAAATGHGDHILLAGDVAHPMTMRAIARADLMLRTTQYDGDAISVREALHFGTRVIATDNGMRPAGVVVVPVGDREALRAAILRELAAPPAPRAAASPAAADVSSLEEVLTVYRELVAE